MDARATIPSAKDMGETPVDWASLRDLYLRPTRFFTAGLRLDERRALLLVLLLVGVARAQGRIDGNLLRAELGSPRPGWESLGPLVTSSWPGYWLYSLVAGLVSALFLWYVGGWWYGLRVKWSGVRDRDKHRARVIYVWAGLVAALPGLLYVVLSTVAFPDYGAAWSSEEQVSTLLIIFPFWGAFVSYRAVRSEFPVSVWRARAWFLILPWLAYALAFGGLVAASLSGA